MPDRRSRPVACEAPAGTAAGRLLPPGLQRAAFTRAADVAEPAAPVRSSVRSQRRHPARSRSQPQASRCRNRFPLDPAHLGTDTHSPSAHPLRCSRWRPGAGSHALDLFAHSLPATRQGAQPRLPRQVRRWPAATLCSATVALFRRVYVTSRPASVRCLPTHSVPAGLDRLRQAAFWRPRACASLPGTLYPPRCHLQPSTAHGYREGGRLSLEGLP